MEEKKRKIHGESEYRRPNHYDTLVSMWNQGDFCDVTIQVDDKIYPAHKIILIAYIPYFRNMFSHAFLETNKNIISISYVNPQSMKTIIQFAYTGLISWEDVDDLPSLIKDADFLGLEDVKNKAIKFLECNFDCNKAIEAYHLSRMVCSSSLKEWSRKIVQKNFEAVSKTDQFLRLNFDEIKDLLSEEYSKLYTHELFKGALRWIEHDIADRYSNLKELCSLIQIGNADFHDVREIVNDAYYWSKLRQNTSLKSEIELYHQKSKDNIEAGVNVKNYVSGIIACNEKNSKEFMMYHTALEKWQKIEGIKEPRWNFRVAVSNFHLFIIGGVSRKLPLKFTVKNESLDLRNPLSSWKRISPLGTPRRWFGVISVSKYIFVCGGESAKNCALNSVEKYTVATNTWTYVAPMKFDRRSFSVAAVDNYLYAIGGMDKIDRMVKEIERYDLKSDYWETLSTRLETARRHFGIAVLDKKIYVCGGLYSNQQGLTQVLDSVEVYDPSTNNWQYVASMPEARHSLFVTSHAGKLWAMGGMNKREDFSNVLEYDPKINKWSDIQMKMETAKESIELGFIVGCTV